MPLSPPKTLLVAVLMLSASLLSASPAWADRCEPATDAEKTLVQAFKLYCGTFGSDPPDFCDTDSAGNPLASCSRQYLALEAVCPSSDRHCTEFASAHASTMAGHQTLPPLVIALDHETGRWQLRNRLAGAQEPRVKFDVAGEPTVSLARQERITVVVENTNPLLYGATAGKPTEVDVPELAAIQKLLAALGGNIGAFLRVVGDSESAAAASGDPVGDYTRKH